MTFLCNNPWIFHRDELDLLEEEMDDIYRLHRAGAPDQISDMEDRVLKEQMQTEEYAELELALEIGPDYLCVRDREGDHGHDFASDSLSQTLRAYSSRDPLYEQVYLWSQRVFRYTFKRYFSEQKKKEDFFHAHVNVNMIPIKFASAFAEKIVGDSISDRIAHSERQLCLTYFVRTLGALHSQAFSGDEEAVCLEKEGRELERLVRQHL